MRKAYDLLLAAASTSPMILIYVVKKKLAILPGWPPYISYMCVFVGVIFLNATAVALFRCLSRDTVQGELKDVELANSSFLPNYLGYFFVAVSIEDAQTFILVYGLTLLLVMLSQSMYFNPLLLLRYNFYHATDEQGTRLFLITKRKIRTIQAEGFGKLRRINDVTYIEL